MIRKLKVISMEEIESVFEGTIYFFHCTRDEERFQDTTTAYLTDGKLYINNYDNYEWDFSEIEDEIGIKKLNIKILDMKRIGA